MRNDIKAFINSSGISATYVIGGTGAIAGSTVSALPNIKRLSGANRYQTNLAVIKEFTQNNTISFTTLYAATGTAFADALSGAAEAAKDNAAVLLVSNNNYNDFKDSIDLIHSNLRNISTAKMLGGTGVISDTLANKIINPDRIF